MNFNSRAIPMPRPQLSTIILAMKLTAIFIIAVLTNVSATSYSQIVTLHENKTSVEKVLRSIEKQTGYHFLYDKQDVSKAGTVNIEADRVSIQKALDECFKNQPLTYKIFEQTIVVRKQDQSKSKASFALQKIQGTVTDNKGQPLPGVSVKVKGTTIGTVTDVDGKYSLNVQGTETLVFTFIGFNTQEIPVNGKTVIDITLAEDSRQLNEVVVTALGIKRSARELGYATQQVNAKDLTQSRPTNLAAGLSGKVAGLQIIQANNQIDAGDQVRVVLRGNRSFAGNNQALLVLDGVVTPLGYLNSINPNDVESVNVLKGANAAALYGSEASNGVLIVTTKRGAKGINQITYTNTTSLNQLAYFPKMQTQFGGGSGQDIYGFPQYTPFENQNFGDRFDGSLRPLGRTLPDGSIQMVPYSNLSDEKKKFFDTGVDEQNDLSFTTGNENGSTYFNMQRVNSKGYVPGDKSNRTALRVNGTHTYNHFKIDYNVNYTQRNIDKSNAQVYNNIINTPANIPLTQYRDINSLYGSLDNYFNDYGLNPYFYLQEVRNKERRDDLLGSLSLSYDVAPWLNLTAKGGINTQNRNGKNITEAINYSDFANASGKAIANPQSRPAGESDYSNFIDGRMEGSFLATFKKKISDFTGTFILGTQLIQVDQRRLSAGTDYLVIPDFYNVGYRAGDANVGESNSKYRRNGVFGDLTIGYKSYLFLHASARNDWDSRLSSENRSFFYPSVDLSFVFTDAIKALKDNRILSYGKLRGGIAKVSAVQFDPYSLQATFDVGGGFPYGSTAGYSIGNTVYAPNLKPEETVSNEIGLELGFLDNRLSLESSAYWETTKNQEILGGINISNATGFSNAIINTGTGKNHGIELSLKGTPIMSHVNGINWNLGINYSYNQNKAVSLYQGLPNLSIGNNNYIVQGQPYPVLMGNGFATDPQGHTIVNPNTGYPVLSSTNILFGQTTPKNILGINTSISYHNFTLAGTAEYRSGSVVYSGAGSTMDFSGISYGSATNGRERFVYPNSVIETSPGVYIPNTNITTNSGGIDYWAGSTTRYGVMQNYVTSAAFWKIRELSLGYEIPARYLKQVKFIKKANFALVGRNLFMFRPKTNRYSDPEFNATLDNAQGSNNLNQTPPTRIYGFTATFTL